jgi:SOS response regulatory protein OraA/RecX
MNKKLAYIRGIIREEVRKVLREQLSTDKQAADAVITAIAKFVKKYGEGPDDSDLKDAQKIAKLIMQKNYKRAARAIDYLDTLVREKVPREVFRYLKKKGADFWFDYS